MFCLVGGGDDDASRSNARSSWGSHNVMTRLMTPRSEQGKIRLFLL